MIEIATYSLDGALQAARAGADRIELCSAPSEGGLTPGISCIRMARKALDIPIHVMIRPRGGDFLYSDMEFECMIEDIRQVKDTGVAGIVAGVLLPDGTIDQKRVERLLLASEGLDFTFHRAFDMSNNLFASLEILKSLGIKRILTSGGKATAPAGFSTIVQLARQAEGKISIMPGSGINDASIRQFLSIREISEFHLSARKIVPGNMTFKNPDLRMGSETGYSEYDLFMPDEIMIGKIKNLTNSSLPI